MHARICHILISPDKHRPDGVRSCSLMFAFATGLARERCNVRALVTYTHRSCAVVRTSIGLANPMEWIPRATALREHDKLEFCSQRRLQFLTREGAPSCLCLVAAQSRSVLASPCKALCCACVWLTEQAVQRGSIRSARRVRRERDSGRPTHSSSAASAAPPIAPITTQSRLWSLTSSVCTLAFADSEPEPAMIRDCTAASKLPVLFQTDIRRNRKANHRISRATVTAMVAAICSTPRPCCSRISFIISSTMQPHPSANSSRVTVSVQSRSQYANSRCRRRSPRGRSTLRKSSWNSPRLRVSSSFVLRASKMSSGRTPSRASCCSSSFSVPGALPGRLRTLPTGGGRPLSPELEKLRSSCRWKERLTACRRPSAAFRIDFHRTMETATTTTTATP
mmetsp:Transcript_15577/g.37019  ORF Transcript_15577/g.37019 Transcript_15577/m.37019 type:complete len:395 (+) Transcript_15577:1727-2911(+)